MISDDRRSKIFWKKWIFSIGANRMWSQSEQYQFMVSDGIQRSIGLREEEEGKLDCSFRVRSANNLAHPITFWLPIMQVSRELCKHFGDVIWPWLFSSSRIKHLTNLSIRRMKNRKLSYFTQWTWSNYHLWVFHQSIWSNINININIDINQSIETNEIFLIKFEIIMSIVDSDCYFSLFAFCLFVFMKYWSKDIKISEYQNIRMSKYQRIRDWMWWSRFWSRKIILSINENWWRKDLKYDWKSVHFQSWFFNSTNLKFFCDFQNHQSNQIKSNQIHYQLAQQSWSVSNTIDIYIWLYEIKIKQKNIMK
jgi:hypothetical protein